MASATYLLAIDSVIGMTQFTMLVCLVDAVVDHMLTYLACIFVKRSSATDDVIVSYYTKARVDIDEEARGRDVLIKSRVEADLKMMEAFQSVIECHARLKSFMVYSEHEGHAVKSDAGVSSEDDITMVGAEAKAVRDNKASVFSISSDGSSARSGARTD